MDEKVKEPVRLRLKSLSNGSKSIYLDYYANGKREYEFLKLYLVPEATPDNKFTNIEVLSLANAIKAKRIVAIQSGAHGFSVNYDNRSNADVLNVISHNTSVRKLSLGFLQKFKIEKQYKCKT